MSIGLYDKAIGDKIRSWVMDPKMTIYYPDETNRIFTQNIDERNDAPLQLPLIAISRDPSIDIKIVAKRPLSHRGKVFEANNENASQLNAIPLGLKYQIDIYTRYREEADEYFRNFIFQIINHPTIQIELPYMDCKINQKSFMTLENTADDNSDVRERLVVGQFTRLTIRFDLDDAYIYSYTTKAIPKISTAGIFVDQDNSTENHQHGDTCELDTEIKNQ